VKWSDPLEEVHVVERYDVKSAPMSPTSALLLHLRCMILQSKRDGGNGNGNGNGNDDPTNLL